MTEEIESHLPPPKMPPEIAKAIVKVSSEVRQLGQDGRNQFAKFDYVSVDKFYDQIGQLMAKAGIFVLCHEASVLTERREATGENGVTKTSVWITFVYDLFLYHESGTGYGPVQRTIMVPATGPQAFGSGMSYVEKYFLRSLFKVPTGEQDADADPQEGVPAAGNVKSAKTATPKADPPKPVEPPHDPATGEVKPHQVQIGYVQTPEGDKSDWRGWGTSIIAAVKSAASLDDLRAWQDLNQSGLASCAEQAPKAYKSIVGAIDKRRAELTEAKDYIDDTLA